MSNDNVRILGDLEIKSALSFGQNLSGFPLNPKPRTLVVKDGQPFIYTEVVDGSGYFSWTPLGVRQNSYLHTQGLESTTWTVTHNLNVTDFAYFVYDNDHALVLANSTIIDANTIQIQLSEAITGTVIVFGVAHVVASGVTAVDNVTINSIVLRDASGTLTVNDKVVAFAGYVDSSIAAEATARNTADAALGARIDNVLSNLDPATLDSLTEIVATFQSADNTINSAIAASAIVIAADIAAESTRAVVAEGKLTTAVAAEATTARAAEGQLTSDLSVESTTARAAEGKLTSDLSVESTTARAAEGKLTSDLGVESTTARAAEGKLTTAVAAEAIARADADSALAASVYTKTQADAAVLTYLSKVTQDIIPAVNLGANLGSETHQFHSLYVGPGTVYVNGKPVIQDNSDTITFSTDPNQNLRMQTAGSGHLEIQAGDAGSIDIKGTLSIQSGKRIIDSAGTQVQFGDDVQMNNNKVVGLGVPTAAGDAATKSYVDGLTTNDSTLVRTVGTQSIAGAKTFSDNITISGNLVVSGVTFTVDSETIRLADNLIDLNSNFTSGTPSENSGLRIIRGDEPSAQLRWNESIDKWEVSGDSVGFSVLALSSDVSAATAAAAADATAKVLVETNARVTAVSGAITTASTDATTKASAAQAAAVATASTDATAKVAAEATARNTAIAAAIATKDNTDEITEGSTNLYFTDARVAARVSSGLANFHSAFQSITASQATTNATSTVSLTFADLATAKHYNVYLNRMLLRPTEVSVNGSIVTIAIGTLATDDEIEVSGLKFA
jgi:hypothetical protein